MKSFKIGNKDLFKSNKTYIVAEISANHVNDFNIVEKTIKAIKESGADAVKVQTFTPDSITIDSNKEIFCARKDTIWAGKKLYDLYKEAALPFEWHSKIKIMSNDIGLDFFSTPFDKKDTDFLCELGVPAYKVASLEITDIPLISHIAKKKKPIILSTGIATKEDIDLAIQTCKKAGNYQIALLKCTSTYPAPYKEINLNTIPDLIKKFDVIGGISDHTLGFEIAIGAVVKGAKIVEKHFILDKKLGGPDASFSMEPNEFKQMINCIRNIEEALGTVNYELTESTLKSRKNARSIFIVEDILKGEPISNINIRSIRPGYGLHPKHYYNILGKIASKDLKKGEPLKWEDFY